jgi:hypothetical protein
MDDGDLQSHFLRQAVQSAAGQADGGYDHGPYDNANHYTPMFDRNGSGGALPTESAFADERDRISGMFVTSAETGGMRDAAMTNTPVFATAPRHSATNEPPLPEVPANTIRGQLGSSGVVQDRQRKIQQMLNHNNVDAHRALNSFHPTGTKLKEYEWNEGGALDIHQGMGIRFNQSSYNKYARSVLPRDVPKKIPLPMSYDPRQERGAPPSQAVVEAMRSEDLLPRSRDSRHSGLAETDYSASRSTTKDGGAMGPYTRPDMEVHRTRRDNPEPRMTYLQSPFLKADRSHALFSRDAALLRQQQILDDSF